MRDRVAIDAMVADLAERFGQIDVLVNCAGIFAGGPSEDVTAEEWDRVIGINLTAVFACSQAVARVMIPQRSGSIVNIGSLTAMGGWAKRACYGTSKAAVVALSQILGVEWIKYGIRVNVINPGQIETPFNEAAFKAGLGDREVFTNRAPMRRFGMPEEIADAVLFLASDESSNVNAQVAHHRRRLDGLGFADQRRPAWNLRRRRDERSHGPHRACRRPGHGRGSCDRRFAG